MITLTMIISVIHNSTWLWACYQLGYMLMAPRCCFIRAIGIRLGNKYSIFS